MAGGRSGQRLAAIFALGVLLFNYPMLAVFDRPLMVLGVPLLYAYLFAAWALLIGLAAWSVRRGT
jgi:hypothetical protein